jgi:hypothetical protein
MKLRWTAKGDVATQLFTWLALLIGGLIIILWFIRSGIYNPVNDLEILDQDLLHIQLMLDDACSSVRYHNTYNPLLESGNLTFNNNQICMTILDSINSKNVKVTRCIETTCNLGVITYLSLSEIKEFGIIKDETITIYST